MARFPVAFRRAVELLRAELGGVDGEATAAATKAAASRVIEPLTPGADSAALLGAHKT